MSTVLLDTHVWYWLFTSGRALPEAASDAIERADKAWVCSISVYEIARKAGIGKWPGMDEQLLDRLVQESESRDIRLAHASPAALNAAGFINWAHRDPWDRLIAAVALDLDATLVSADVAFDVLTGLQRIWNKGGS